MKKIFLFFATIVVSVSMMAQQKGEMSLSGTLLISGSNSVVATNVDGQTTTEKNSGPVSFDLGVGFGYFVADNVKLGIGLCYGLDRSKNSASTSEYTFFDSSSSFTIKPEIAYYVPLTRNRFFWTPAFAMGFGFNSTKSQMDKTTVTTMKDPFLFTLGVDILAFELRPWKHLAFDFSFGGLYYKTSSIQSSSDLVSVKTVTHNITFGFSDYFSPTLGVKYIF